jgi:hypothetical protein
MTNPEETAPVENLPAAAPPARPFLLTLLCLPAFTFFTLLSLVYIAVLVRAGWITEVTNKYLGTSGESVARNVLMFGGGFLLHGLAVAGVILMWRIRKTGYYLLGGSCIVISVFQLFNPRAEVVSTAVYMGFLLLFGLFFRRLH